MLLPTQVLLKEAAGSVDTGALTVSNWSAVPATLPTIALAFVYQNVVPVISSSLEVSQSPETVTANHVFNYPAFMSHCGAAVSAASSKGNCYERQLESQQVSSQIYLI